jgi:hypothetical protein
MRTTSTTFANLDLVELTREEMIAANGGWGFGWVKSVWHFVQHVSHATQGVPWGQVAQGARYAWYCLPYVAALLA